ncbi:hypothetical protein EWM64_g3642 [Hericium alpestre]|uniref:Protein kinase domain-containing protein n=1 Tax=Hericium alpestre TaxID=135208 RepID=A0A4Y9ZZW5_9AGAM|nr:hypothetical protein EWM64_g3642 [Hericium alpestre]
MSTSASVPRPPALGTYIDNGSLELVSILGYGGYGVVYRAIDTSSNSPNPPTYAVKCLIHAQMRNATRQRRLHIQEITLHQLASVHPHVVTLHRVVEEDGCTFIVMDYSVDAVEFCHSLGIYHRDLKPENVLCFSGGLRLAITDFGLATTEKISDEFRTGSVYHMSPECQGGVFAPSGTYSPPFNDIWSLGIILLNLITGRNPWKSASVSDPTFNAYLQDPTTFLPSVLPISSEVNEILLQTLDVNWQSRITLRELRHAIKNVETFYAEDVVFEGSMARCSWEAGIDITGDDSPEEPRVELPQPEEPKSTWSADSAGEGMVFAQGDDDQRSWSDYSNARPVWADEAGLSERSLSPVSPISFTMRDDLRTPSSTYSMYSPALSDPASSVNPEDGSATFVEGSDCIASQFLTIDTSGRQYDTNIIMHPTDSSTMHTAFESVGTRASSFFLPTSVAESKPSYAASSTFEVGISTFGDDIEDQLQDAMSWTQPSVVEPSHSGVFDVPASMVDLEGTPEQATAGHSSDNPWRDYYRTTPRPHATPPPPPEGAAVPFPLFSYVSSPASTTAFPPTNDTGCMRTRPKPRASSFFVRLAMPRSPPAAPSTRKKGRLSADEVSYAVSPIGPLSAPSPPVASRCLQFGGRPPIRDAEMAQQQQQDEQARADDDSRCAQRATGFSQGGYSHDWTVRFQCITTRIARIFDAIYPTSHLLPLVAPSPSACSLHRLFVSTHSLKAHILRS